MIHSEALTDNRILQSLPDDIHAAVLIYASESELTLGAVVAGAVKRFLELNTSLSNEPVSTIDDKVGLWVATAWL